MDISFVNIVLTLWAVTATTLLFFAMRKQRAETRDKSSQSQCTYTSVRGSEKPRFLELPEFSQG